MQEQKEANIEQIKENLEQNITDISKMRPDFNRLLSTIIEKTGKSVNRDLSWISTEINDYGSYDKFFSQDFSKISKEYVDTDNKDFSVGEKIKIINAYYDDEYYFSGAVAIVPIGTECEIDQIELLWANGKPLKCLRVNTDIWPLYKWLLIPEEIAKKGTRSLGSTITEIEKGDEVELVKETGWINVGRKGIVHAKNHDMLTMIFEVGQEEAKKSYDAGFIKDRNYAVKLSVPVPITTSKGYVKKIGVSTMEGFLSKLSQERARAEEDCHLNDYCRKLHEGVSNGYSELSGQMDSKEAVKTLRAILEKSGLSKDAIWLASPEEAE
jgi:hypothetical protein